MTLTDLFWLLTMRLAGRLDRAIDASEARFRARRSRRSVVAHPLQ